MAAAAVVYTVHAIAWPIDLGRDGGSFLLHYFDLFRTPPTIPQIATYRTPLPALWFGSILSSFGPYALEMLHGLLFVAAVWMAARTALFWGRAIAVVVAAVMLIHAWYAGLYHRVDSDGLFAFVFAMWVWYAINTADRRSGLIWIGHGMLVFGLVMIRPAAQIFVLFSTVPLGLSDRPVRVRIRQAVIMFLTCSVLLAGWSSYNYVHHGFFATSRLTYAAQPFLRLFIHDRLIRSGNGPASRELAAAVEQHLLPHEPYRSLGMSADEFLANGTMRTWSDIVVVSDLAWGWESHYGKLRDVSVEAIRQNPGAYAVGVLGTLIHACIVKLPTAFATTVKRSTAVDDVPHLFPELVSHSYADWTLSTPDHRYHPDAPNRATAIAELRRLEEEAKAVQQQLPPRDGIVWLSNLLNRVGLLLAPMLLVIVAGAASLPFLCLNHNPRERVLCACWAMSLLYLAATFAGQVPAIIHYRLPFDPVFVITALVGMSALRRGRRQLKLLHASADARHHPIAERSPRQHHTERAS